MTKLFKPVPDDIRRSISIIIRLNQAEAAQIRHAADIRCLTVSDFIRRAALGRKADVRFETHIVLALHHVVQEIREMHKTYLEQGFQPPEELWLPLIKEAGAAMLRISK
jgi:uncharacterized protein (DUF1778 family)